MRERLEELRESGGHLSAEDAAIVEALEGGGADGEEVRRFLGACLTLHCLSLHASDREGRAGVLLDGTVGVSSVSCGGEAGRAASFAGPRARPGEEETRGRTVSVAMAAARINGECGHLWELLSSFCCKVGRLSRLPTDSAPERPVPPRRQSPSVSAHLSEFLPQLCH